MDGELHVEQQVPSGILRGINFNIVTEADAEKASVLQIEAINEVTDPKLGVPNPTGHCPTCGAKDAKHCEGHFGVIRFPCTILHPYYISEVAQILNKICPGCKSLRQRRVKGADSTSRQRQARNCKYCDGSIKDFYPRMKFKVSMKDMFGKTAIIAEVNENLLKKVRSRGSREVLASDYWDIIPKDAQQEESLLKPNKRVLSHAQVYHMLKDVDPRFLKEFILSKNSLFLSCFPVTPNCHRVSEFAQHMIFDERTRAYKKLVDFRGTANELSLRVLDSLKSSKIHSEKSSTNDSASYLPKKDSASSMSGLKYIKEVLLGKRSDHAFRMVIVGDPNIKLSEIGLPCYIAERLQISEQLNSWNWEKLNTCCNLRILEKGEIFVRRKGGLLRVGFMDKLKIGDIIYRPLIDGDIVLINRPPSIHQHSLIALSVKVLPINSVLSINPLICSPFRGDFDGDCIHGYVPQSIDSRTELHELVSLNKQLINRQSGRNLLSLNHDSLTAAHLVVEDGVVLNLFQMQQLQMFCPRQLELPAIAKATSPDACFWTGKQLFSLLLPPEFEYAFPSNGVYISKGELLSSSDGSSWLRDSDGNLFHSLVKHCQQKALDFLYAAQEVLCEWLSMRGLSVSLSDLYLSSDSHSRKNMIDEVSCGLRQAELISHIKLLMVDSNQDFLVGSGEESESAVDFGVERMCYEKQKSAALSRASVSAFKQVFWDIQNLVYQYASKDNSLLAMLKAGSKGNLMRLVQHSMCLGLQHSLVPLSFRIPHQLSCAAWNNHKAPASTQKTNNISECAGPFIPYAVVENSFLTGLNPLECFVHSLTTRNSSFSDNADLPGTLNRRLMFFMRDIYIGYDGTVRNAYGNQLVQFSYDIEAISSSNDTDCSFDDNTNACGAMASEPVGSLAACAISEAAYSALDQPISVLETSPLLNLKKTLECGVKKISGDKTASLFLSKKLGRWTYGFEYGALEIQNHLERLLFSDIVSTVMIFFSPPTHGRTHSSPWVCHFHICKEIAKRRRLKLDSVIDALCVNYNSSRMRLKNNLPNLHITSKDCGVTDKQKENEATFCITVTIVEGSRNSCVQLENLRDTVIPYLLGTVIKGFLEIKKVDILWKDQPNVSRSHFSSSGELYLRVYMSENCDRSKFWSVLVNNCLQIMDMIDWDRSYPDDIRDVSSAYGIDVAWKCFLSNLKIAISDTGKCILSEHLLLAADCLSATGEFVALNAKGLAQQRKQTSVSSPFTQACFSNPGDCFIKAAKMGVVDNLQGSIDALSWGMIPSIGTGGQFEMLYSPKGHELATPIEVYDLLGSQISSLEQNVKVKAPSWHDRMSNKCHTQPICTYDDIAVKGCKNLEISLTKLRSVISLKDIQRLSQELKYMLRKYPVNHQLSDVDKSIAMMALYFHPRRIEKIGTGFQEIKIGYHSKHENTRCFLLVRTDGTVEDFSYHKCVHGALEIIAPQRAKAYQSRWLNETIRE
ncbi:DNA-directed RNA polymerase IV subunit 1 [Cornus florida]|uniref:DNA-directed RNA polymerase IV subunit 1 n=1 Tax=Cornus florida TaxID=4283 RepID=UPI0028997FC2|nr:DNA-directed RNA polymerase IV subunit 1 [Cornus florida]XP_059661701.1 DNA-directed RNA polymerase IV subunit 1 [Cornus florida]XP_059661702.1 DNA-directed RNA polymerase IV subunit 1 [Cornus florida]XP_059661703.1 DNA-directed RNA polymerase IV subunit 1 [Cornus florida]